MIHLPGHKKLRVEDKHAYFPCWFEIEQDSDDQVDPNMAGAQYFQPSLWACLSTSPVLIFLFWKTTGRGAVTLMGHCVGGCGQNKMSWDHLEPRGRGYDVRLLFLKEVLY